MVLRGVLWLVALFAFVLPPAVMPAMAAAPKAHAVMSDCPFHAPMPPENCPHHKPAKQMAGICCLVMLHTVALMPSFAGHDAKARPAPVPTPAVRDLVGIAFTEDPPPPRV